MLAGLGESVIVGFEVDRYAGPGPSPIAAPYLGLSQNSQQALSSMGAEVTRAWFDGRTREVRFPEGTDVEAALELLRTLPQVRYAILNNSVMPASVVPNDPLFVAQWPLQSPNDVDLNAPQAWDQTTGNAATFVAVADTGIDYTHPDLYLAIALNNAEIPASLSPQLVDTNGDGSIDFYDLNSLDSLGNVVFDSVGLKYNSAHVTDLNANGYIDAGDLLSGTWHDGIDGDGNGFVDDLTGWDYVDNDANPIDVWGHGTHVAGIIGARANNGLGIAGVNWNVRLIPERFIGSVGSIADMIEAIQHAVTQGASVINASWGTFVADLALKDAIQWAGENSVVFVAAAGNHSKNNDVLSSAYYPASFDLPNLISVASIDVDGTLSDFSNYGPNTVSLAAPGAEILSTWLNGSYLNHSGTSMATPHVTGVVSLLAGLFPGATAEWLVDRVLSTVKPLADLQGRIITAGMVDAFVAVNTPNVAGPRVIVASPSGEVPAPTDRVTLTFDRPMRAETFTTNDVAVTGPAGAIAPIVVNRLTDLVFEVVFSPQPQLGIYSVTVGPDVQDQIGQLMDQDRDGNAGEPQDDAFSVVFRQTPPPQIWTIDDGDTGFASTGDWTSYAPDGYGADLLYTQAGNGLDVATWTFPDLTPGQYQVAATWQQFANRVANATYKLSGDGLELAIVQVDQRQQPVSFLEGGKWWQNLSGVINLTGDTLTVSIDDLASPADGYLIADAIRLRRVGELASGAEIEVRSEDGKLLTSGIYDFGRLEYGSSATRTFNVRNAGLADLTFSEITVPNGFSLVSGFGATTLATGQTTSFTLKADADSLGVFSGTLSFTSNDADDSPFSLNVTSFVAPVWIVDDGNSGFALSGGWSTYLGAGRQGDLRFKAVGGGAEVASWTFTDLPAGRYRVSATWLEYSNRVGDARYTILDDVAALSTTTVDQRLAPADFIDEGSPWHDLEGLFDIVGGVLRVELGGHATIGDYLIADAVRIERVEGLQLPPGPEIQLFLGSTGLADGVSTVDFGRTDIGVSVIQSFTIRNGGSSELVLGAIDLPAGFSLASNFGAATLAPGQTTSIEVRLDADSFGAFEGQVSVASNDGDEASFDFTVRGSVSAVWTVDDGDTGFTATGGWTGYAGDGWNGDFLYRQVGNETETASWTFTGLQPGQYRISATWLEYSNRAIDAEYKILDGTATLDAVQVDQRQSPSSFSENGRWWQDLAGSLALVEGTLTVQLSDLAGPAGSYVIADAIRLERIGNLSQEAVVQVIVEGSLIEHGIDILNFGSTEVGVTTTKTITVRNVGLSDLTVEQVILPPGFSLASNPGGTMLTTGQSMNFVVQLDAGAQGAFAGTVQIVPQGVEDSFDFGVTGIVAEMTPAVWIVDNGDAAFSVTGGWTTYVGDGALGDCAYIQAGDGSELASWTFAGLTPGLYRVSVTWLPYVNRAADASYSVLDGSTTLVTDTIDQRVSPDDLFADGQWWHDLALAAEVVNGELVVRLSNLAGPIGSYLIADAVRVERVGDPS